MFTLGVVLIGMGWWVAWFLGDWVNMERNAWDHLGSAMFGIGLGMCIASMVIMAMRYMP